MGLFMARVCRASRCAVRRFRIPHVRCECGWALEGWVGGGGVVEDGGGSSTVERGLA